MGTNFFNETFIFAGNVPFRTTRTYTYPGTVHQDSVLVDVSSSGNGAGHWVKASAFGGVVRVQCSASGRHGTRFRKTITVSGVYEQALPAAARAAAAPVAGRGEGEVEQILRQLVVIEQDPENSEPIELVLSDFEGTVVAAAVDKVDGPCEASFAASVEEGNVVCLAGALGAGAREATIHLSTTVRTAV